MGAGPMTPLSADGSWRLTPDHAARTQGLLVSPFAHLPEGRALFLGLPDGCGGAWLSALRAACPVTDATGKATPAAALAFTWAGLQAMRLEEAALATFATPFQEGMHQSDRQRRLSDTPDSGTVVEGGPRWGGNVPDHFSDPLVPLQPPPTTVHAALLLYGEDRGSVEAWAAQALSVLQGAGVAVVHHVDLALRFDAAGRAREHFGFADGLSQPVPQGAGIVSRDGTPLPPDRLHGIAAGDILMGHTNAHGEPAAGPIIAASLPGTACLPSEGAPHGFRNLGLDGSYLVIRELHQDVAAFWNGMHAAMDGDPELLASRVVGRTMDGDVLVPGGTLPPNGPEPRNDFTYFAIDPHGMGCPIGSHVRRANPRDSLASKAGNTAFLLAAAQSHRILRRGRKFGPDIADRRTDDKAERGLLFMALNTDLVRQFEFVQQTWMLNTNFGTLLDETDPLLGPQGRYTIPAEPLRLRPTIPTFIRFAGGEYFFLPSLPALDYLQTLPAIFPAPP